MVLSDKYAAGFLDSDGSIYVSNGRLWLEFVQKRAADGVIDLLSQWLPGGGRYERTGRRRGTVTYSSRLVYTGQRAVDVLCRLKPYLVSKRVRANRLLCELGFTERVGTDSIPVYPARKWLAGYFDGDGCIYAGLTRSGGAAVKLSIDGCVDEAAGLELVQKAFGGSVNYRGENSARWELSVDAAKAKQVLQPFAKHLVIKREQAYFILGCAAMGHFRDGETIVSALKDMKTHPHRLSDLAAEVDVSAELRSVQNFGRSDSRLRAA